jgi:hypothetical protein
MPAVTPDEFMGRSRPGPDHSRHPEFGNASPELAVTKEGTLPGLNQPEDLVLTMVLMDGGQVGGPCHLSRQFQQEPDFGVAGMSCDLAALIAHAEGPQCP